MAERVKNRAILSLYSNGFIRILKLGLRELMAYWHDIYKFRDSIEHEFKYAGQYGAKGEKRQKKKKATPEQIAKQNQQNRENRTRRTIKLNFEEKDLWCCFKYPAGTKPSVQTVKNDKRELLKILRKQYKKRGCPLKYYARMEIGKEGSAHFHVLLNRIWDAQTDVIITDAWDEVLRKSFDSRGKPLARTDGLVDWKTTYQTGGFKKLANYIVKRPEEGSEEYEQMTLFNDSDQKELLSITSSRNLIRPEPERHTYSKWTMRKIIDKGPKPEEGYYIDKDSLYIGINPYTGMSYMKYTEVKITNRGQPEGG